MAEVLTITRVGVEEVKELIIKHKRTYKSVPSNLKDQVKKYLASQGFNTDGNYVGGGDS